MSARRIVLAAVLLVVAALLQICAVQPIPFPVGRPDLPILAVVALGLGWGPIWGSATGFAVGLLIDLMPPSDHAVGQLAFAYAAVGYAVGLFGDEEEHSVLATILMVVAACIGLVAIDLALGIVLGDGTVTADSAARLFASTAGYDVVLAPFVVPLILRLSRRAEIADAR